MNTPTPPETSDFDDVRELARTLAVVGFSTLDEIRTHLEDAFEDEPVTAEQITAAADQAWQDRLAEQATWTSEGDHARLARAFDALASAGVVGRMNFTCCQTCGHDEIDDERTPTADGGFAEWGYTFFHQQDAESLVYSGDLYLAFGTFGPVDGIDPELLARAAAGDEDAREAVGDACSTRVGTVITQALRAEGLAVTWDGTAGRRIQVALPDWRKPLPV